MKKILKLLAISVLPILGVQVALISCPSTDCGGNGQAYSNCSDGTPEYWPTTANLTASATTMNIGETLNISSYFKAIGNYNTRELAIVYRKDSPIESVLSHNIYEQAPELINPTPQVGTIFQGILGHIISADGWGYDWTNYFGSDGMRYTGTLNWNFTPTSAGTYYIYAIERGVYPSFEWTIVCKAWGDYYSNPAGLPACVVITVNDNWTAFDEVGAWQDYGAWSPAPGWYWENQSPTTTPQTRTKRRWHRTGERNTVGTERNVGGYWENGSDSQTVANSSRPNPSISVQVLDGSKNIIGLNGNGRAPVPCNSYFYIRVNGSDPWGSLQTLYSRLNDANGTGVDYPAVGVSGANASYDFGPYYTGNSTGVWNMWAHVCSAGETGYQWWGNGWAGTETPDIEVYNRAPTASISLNRSSANVGDSVTITLTANDPDGNLDYTNLWVATPNYGWRWIHSDNTVATGGALDRNHSATPLGSQGTFTRSFTFTLDQGFGNYTFQLTAVDALGASVTPSQQVVTVNDRYPTVTMSASPTSIYFGQSTTVTATASDEDGNLYFSGIMALNQARDTWQRSPSTDYSDSWWGNYPTSTNFVGANHSTGRVSGGYASMNVTYKPSWAGYVTFHTNSHDPYNWASARPDWCAVASNYGYVDVTVLKTTPTINGVNNQTFTGTHTVVASDISANSTNPYDGSVAQASLPFYVWNGSSWEGFSVGRVFMPGTYRILADSSGTANYEYASKEVLWTIVNRPPQCSPVSGPTSVTIGQSATYTFNATDPDGDMTTMETYFADPTLGFGVSGNWWPNRVDYPASGSNYTINRTFTFNQIGNWQAAFRVSDTSGWYNYWVIGSNNWSNVLNITVNKATPTVNFSSPGVIYVNQTANLSASVSGGYNPTGGISYSIIGTSGGANGSISGSVLTVTNLGNSDPGYITVRATYAGDANNNASSTDVVVTVPNRAPSGLFTIDGAGASKTITVGQTVLIASTLSDPDGNMATHSIWWDLGNGTYWANPWIAWSVPVNSTGWSELSSTGNGWNVTNTWTDTLTGKFTPWATGTYTFHSAGGDGPTWVGIGPSDVLYLTVQKASPSITFPVVADTYVGQSVNLNASTSGGYSPTGAITYAIVATTGGATGSISGSTLNVTGLSSGNPGTITVRATYPGDSNNNSVTVDRTMNVPNRLPSITLSADATSIVAGQAITFTVTGTDPDGNLTWLNLDIPTPGGYFQVNAGPYTFDGSNVPNNGWMSFTQTSNRSQTCTITFTNPGVYVFTGCGGDPLGRGDSAPMTVTVSPRLTSASITDQSGRLSAVATSSTSIEFGQSVTFSVTSSNLSSVTVAENGTPIQTTAVTGSPTSVTATPQNGGNRTITIYPTSGGGVQGTVVVNQYGATAIRITQPDGSVRTEPTAGPILVYQIGNYSIQAVWSSGANTTISSAIVATLADPGTPLATISIGVRPRIDSFGVVGTLPEVNPTTPTLKVTPTVAVLPGDDFVIPSSVDIAWTNSTGAVTGPGITAQNSVNGSTSLTLTNALLTGDGTVTYTMAGRVKTYYAQWASTAGSAAALQYSSDNVSFATYSAVATSGTTGILPVGYYRIRITNAAGSTSSAAMYCTGNVTEPAITASIQPKVPLAVLTANPLMGSAYPSKNYIFNTVADVVTAVANTGFQVTNFTGDTYGASSIAANVQGATTGSVSGLVMTAPRVVTAHFDYLTYQITKSVNRDGTLADNGSVSLAGISHTDYFGTTGYRYNSTVTATYTPEVTAFGNPKYELAGWTDNGVSAPPTPQYSVSLLGSAASSHSIVAFESLRRFPLIVNPVVDGDGSPRVWNRDGTYTDVPVTTTITTSPSSGPFEIDTDVGLSATMPTAGTNPVIRGITWAGGGISTTMNPLAASVFMSSPRTVTVTLHTKLSQTCAWAPPGTVTVGDIVDVNAITSAGYSCEVTFDAGGANVSYNATTKQMVVNTAGVIVLRLWHPGDSTYLPAEPVVYTLTANAALKIKVTPSVRSTSNKEGEVEDNSTQQVITR